MTNAKQATKREGLISRIWNWISFRAKSRAWMMSQLTTANKILKVRTATFADRLKQLDQHKTYYLLCEDLEEVEVARVMLNNARSQMLWDLPNILVTTRELKEDGKA